MGVKAIATGASGRDHVRGQATVRHEPADGCFVVNPIAGGCLARKVKAIRECRAFRGGCRAEVGWIDGATAVLVAVLVVGGAGSGGVTTVGPFQTPVVAIRWRWSLVRLWVAISNRHSVRTADLPLRRNRLTLLL